MPEEDIHQPHDKLFAIGFGDPANAAGLLKAQFPAELVAQIDWSALKSVSGSFVANIFHRLLLAPLCQGEIVDVRDVILCQPGKPIAHGQSKLSGTAFCYVAAKVKSLMVGLGGEVSGSRAHVTPSFTLCAVTRWKT
jgi:hypothetical protein